MFLKIIQKSSVLTKYVLSVRPKQQTNQTVLLSIIQCFSSKETEGSIDNENHNLTTKQENIMSYKK